MRGECLRRFLSWCHSVRSGTVEAVEPVTTPNPSSPSPTPVPLPSGAPRYGRPSPTKVRPTLCPSSLSGDVPLPYCNPSSVYWSTLEIVGTTGSVWREGQGLEGSLRERSFTGSRTRPELQVPTPPQPTDVPTFSIHPRVSGRWIRRCRRRTLTHQWTRLDREALQVLLPQSSVCLQ